MFNSPNNWKSHEQSSDTTNLSAEINEGKVSLKFTATNTQCFNIWQNSSSQTESLKGSLDLIHRHTLCVTARTLSLKANFLITRTSHSTQRRWYLTYYTPAPKRPVSVATKSLTFLDRLKFPFLQHHLLIHTGLAFKPNINRPWLSLSSF